MVLNGKQMTILTRANNKIHDDYVMQNYLDSCLKALLCPNCGGDIKMKISGVIPIKEFWCKQCKGEYCKPVTFNVINEI